MLSITALYAGLLGLMHVYLVLYVVKGRFIAKVSVGDGGDKVLIKRMRLQGNFTENVPLALILLAGAELQGAPGWVAHLLGAGLVLARLLHGFGFGRTPQIVPMRQAGVVLTMAIIVVASLANIGHALL